MMHLHPRLHYIKVSLGYPFFQHMDRHCCAGIPTFLGELAVVRTLDYDNERQRHQNQHAHKIASYTTFHKLGLGLILCI